MTNRKPTLLIAAAALVVTGIVALIFQIRSRADKPSVAAPPPAPAPAAPAPLPEAPRMVAPEPAAEAPAPETVDFVSPHHGRLWQEGDGPKPIRPKDPDGPERDWRDFNDEEKAAQTSLEHDTADFGEVIARLEQGAAIESVRGTPVTPEEQQQLHEVIAEVTETYEDAYNSAYARETTLIDFADSMRAARGTFDTKVREIYGLTDEQFYELFPYRRDLLPP